MQEHKYYREFARIRNFAVYRMTKVEHGVVDLIDIHDKAVDLDGCVTGKFTYTRKYFYFVNTEDAIMAKLSL